MLKHSIPDIKTSDYDYNLPDSLIAFHALEKRDESKLMIVGKDEFKHGIYKDLPDYLPLDTELVFNNTKVIAARLNFTNQNNGAIEIFLLEPIGGDYSSLHNKERSTWKCLIGGAKKWKPKEVLHKVIKHKNNLIDLDAHLVERNEDSFVVTLVWNHNLVFHEMIELAGKTPLPPYIKREVNLYDASRYQTVYAKQEGSVAAPTAGLHFTEELIGNLHQKNITSSQLTLHVGAGTFKPVTASSIAEHSMHKEFFEISKETIKSLSNPSKRIIPVGTTSMRTLESVYWIGLKSYYQNTPLQHLNELKQWEHFEWQDKASIQWHDIFNHLVLTMEKQQMNMLHGHTGICITPGYEFKVAKGLITNFHQPQSTLLLIIAAILGDRWREMYNTAIRENYRFLSYGDGSLLFIE